MYSPKKRRQIRVDVDFFVEKLKLLGDDVDMQKKLSVILINSLLSLIRSTIL